MMRRQLLKTVGGLAGGGIVHSKKDSLDIDVYLASEVEGYGSRVNKMCAMVAEYFDFVNVTIGPQSVIDIDIDAVTAKRGLEQWRDNAPMTDADSALLMVSGKHDWKYWGYGYVNDAHSVCRFAELADSEQVATAATHEIGHNLGLTHEMANGGTLMSTSLDETERLEFSELSRNHIKSLTK